MRRRKINDKLLLQMLKEGKSQRDCARLFGTSESAVSQRAAKLIPPEGVVKALEGLTEKEKGFCLAVAQGKSYTESALEAYDCGSRESAKQIGLHNKNNPKLKNAIAQLLEDKGLGREYRFQKLKSFVDCSDPVIALPALKESMKVGRDYDLENPDADAELNISPEELELLQETAKEVARKVIEASNIAREQKDNGNNEDTNNDT